MELKRIPIFPLSNVVLFPGVRAPLHIFEPRYRQMMEAALAQDRLIGMVTVVPDHAADMSGAPPVFPTGCAGFIRDHQRLADGRYNLVLQGAQRFEIVRELSPEPDQLYRAAEVEFIADAPARDEDTAVLEDLRATVLARVGELVGVGEARTATDALAALEELDHARFVNELCQALGLSAADKQGLLEANGVRERLLQLDVVLQFRVVAQRAPGRGAGSDTVH